jgi:hypothetical protein
LVHGPSNPLLWSTIEACRVPEAPFRDTERAR